MNQRRHLTLVAAAATLMASAPLKVLFNDWSWLVQGTLVVAVVAATGLATRASRVPLWAQPLITLVTVGMAVTLLALRSHAFLGLIPTRASMHDAGALLNQASSDIHNLGIPVTGDPGLLLLTTAGIGLCALVVDFVAVGLRRPAAAGLPMLAIYSVPVAIDSNSVNVLTYVIGAAGFMWLLVTDNIDRVRVFGRRFTGDGKGVDMWEPSPLAAVGRRIAVTGVVVAILVPLAMPGFTKGLIGVLGTVGNGGGDCSTNTCTPGTGGIDLSARLAGQLNAGTRTVIATIQTDDPAPEYLTFAYATQLTKKGFFATTPSGTPVSAGLTNPYRQSPGINFQPFTATVTMKNLVMQQLPIYQFPESGTLQGVDDRWQFDALSGEIFSTSAQTSPGMTYSFTYDKPEYTPAALRTAPPISPSDTTLRAYMQVPESVKAVNDIVNSPLYKANDEYDRVLNLYSYFSVKNSFVYALSTKAGTTGTDIGNFLQQKSGYCVQYAAALAWIVRAAGYPTRVAFGITPGPRNNGVMSVTNLNLHAWTEVYFPTFGWVPFDATPAAGGTQYTVWAPSPEQQGPGGSEGNQTDPNITPGGKGGHPSGPVSAGPFNQHSTPSSGGLGVPWWVAVALLVGIAILATPFLTRAAIRRRRTIAAAAPDLPAQPGIEEIGVLTDDGVVLTAARRRVHAAWDEFIDTLVDYHLEVDATESPRTTAARIAATPFLNDQVVADLGRLGLAEERARYARRPDSGSFAATVREIRRALARRAATGIRLRALLLPPSVVSRWAAAWSRRVTRTTAWVQAVRDSMARFRPRRRRSVAHSRLTQ
jgi:hypothetical protein